MVRRTKEGLKAEQKPKKKPKKKVRVAGKVIKRPETKQEREEFLKTARQALKTKNEKKLREVGSNLDSKFKKLIKKRGISIDRIQGLYKNLPDKIKNYMKFTPEQAKKEQKETLNRIEKKIKELEQERKQAREDEKEAQDEGVSEDAREAEAEQHSIEDAKEKWREIKKNIKDKGVINVDVAEFENEIKDFKEFRFEKEVAEEKFEREKEEAKRVRTTIKTPEGVITGLKNPVTGKFIPDAKGKNVSEFQDLKKQAGTTSTKALQELGLKKKKFQDAVKKATAGKNLSKEDLEAAKFLGVDSQKLRKLQEKGVENKKAANLFEKMLDKIEKGERPDTTKFFELGISDEKASKLATFVAKRGSERLKVGKPDGKKAAKLLSKIESNPRLAVDPSSKRQFYKSAVNYNIEKLRDKGFKDKFKKLDFSEPITKFQKEQEKIQDFIKESKKKVKEAEKDIKEKLKEQIGEQASSVATKVRQGQSVTPKQYRQYLDSVKKNQKNYADELINGIKSVYQLGGKGDKNLKDVIFNPERTASNAWKGFYDQGIKPLIKGYRTLQDAGLGAGQQLYNYGQKTYRYIKTDRGVPFDEDLKKAMKKTINLGEDTAKNTKKILDWTKNNPEKATWAAFVLGTNLLEKTGTKVTKGKDELLKLVRKKPGYVLGSVAGLLGLAETATLKGGGKLLSKLPKVNRVPKLERAGKKIMDTSESILGDRVKYGESRYKYKRNINKKSQKVNINTKGVLKKKNTPFEADTTLNYDLNNNKITGQVKYTVYKKGKPVTKTRNINLEIKDGFLLDTKSGKKIPFKETEFDDVAKRLKETRVKPKNVQKKIIEQEGAFKTGKLEGVTKDIKQFIREGKKIDVTKEKPVDIDVKARKKIEDAMQVSKGDKSAKTVVRKFADSKSDTLLNNEFRRKFLNAIDFDEDVIKGIDKRSSIGRKLGLNKNDAAKVIQRYTKDLKNGDLVQVKGDIKGYKTVKIGENARKPVRQTFKSGLQNVAGDVKKMLKSRKAEGRIKLGPNSLPNSTYKNFSDDILSKIGKTDLRVYVPDLDGYVYFPKNFNYNKIGFLSKALKGAGRSVSSFTGTKAKTKQPTKQATKKLPEQKGALKPKTRQSLKKSFKDKQTLRIRQDTKAKLPDRLKVRLNNNQINEIVKAPRLPKPKDAKGKRLLRDIDIPTPEKLPSNSRYTYNIKTKRGNTIATVDTGLTKNRAKKKIKDYLTNPKTKTNSATMIVSGITKKKDINPVSLKGFKSDSLGRFKILKYTKP